MINIAPFCMNNKLRLSGCNLTERCCEGLASVFSAQSSTLRDVDLTNNNLQDSGLKLVSSGLKNPQCRLEKLRFDQHILCKFSQSFLLKLLKIEQK